MMESWTADECLETTLDLRDKLEGAKDPLEIIAAVQAGIRDIVEYKITEAQRQLTFTVSDRLEDIHRQVIALYRTVVLPRQYRSWWQEAQEELRSAIDFHTKTLEQLRTMPSDTKRQRRKILEMEFGVSPPPMKADVYHALMTDRHFPTWKEVMDRTIEAIIEKYRAREQRLRDNVPHEPQETPFA